MDRNLVDKRAIELREAETPPIPGLTRIHQWVDLPNDRRDHWRRLARKDLEGK